VSPASDIPNKTVLADVPLADTQAAAAVCEASSKLPTKVCDKAEHTEPSLASVEDSRVTKDIESMTSTDDKCHDSDKLSRVEPNYNGVCNGCSVTNTAVNNIFFMTIC